MKTVPLASVALAFLAITAATAAEPLVLSEDFAEPPATNEWHIAGDSSLFRWDQSARNLAVTWDSSRSNSLFYVPFGTFLDRQDDFSFAFDLTLTDIAVGTTAGKPYTFEIAIGLLNANQATNTTFLRGTGMDSPNLVELDYFPDSGFGATVAGTMISSSNQWATSFNSPLELTVGVTYRFSARYAAAQRTMTLTLSSPAGPTELQAITLKDDFGDFAINAFSITSYSDAGQDPSFAGSVLAHGTIDNVRVETPAPPIRRFTGAPGATDWTATFRGWTGWRYTLQRSSDLRVWSDIGEAISGTGETQSLSDASATGSLQFYRVKAEQQ